MADSSVIIEFSDSELDKAIEEIASNGLSPMSESKFPGDIFAGIDSWLCTPTQPSPLRPVITAVSDDNESLISNASTIFAGSSQVHDTVPSYEDFRENLFVHYERASTPSFGPENQLGEYDFDSSIEMIEVFDIPPRREYQAEEQDSPSEEIMDLEMPEQLEPMEDSWAIDENDHVVHLDKDWYVLFFFSF
ncbi:hypothetical protein TKK_0007835 [Trichogramma kaykai]|uniref:Uncharacterized protein n=1 Tax=Trichogramma kaykai TaxID=54128 RepID=A0ABD2X6P4_9HYME